MRTTLFVLAVLVTAACKKDVVTPENGALPSVTAPAVEKQKSAIAERPVGPRTIELKVTEDGFEPSNITLKKDEPVKFVVTRLTDATCATELLIADTDIKADLPLKTPVEISWTPTKTGKVKYGCAMDMMVSGMMLVE
jgi:plastocyanin domain-containing protein